MNAYMVVEIAILLFAPFVASAVFYPIAASAVRRTIAPSMRQDRLLWLSLLTGGFPTAAIFWSVGHCLLSGYLIAPCNLQDFQPSSYWAWYSPLTALGILGLGLITRSVAVAVQVASVGAASVATSVLVSSLDGRHGEVLDLWPPIAAMGLWLLGASLVMWRWSMVNRLGSLLCPHCRYDLTGLAGPTCPECGNPTPPAAPGPSTL